jgi:fatty-acyl-CoA synthase
MNASYVHGASATPLLGATLGAFFADAVKRWGERPALVVREQGVRWSYAELGERVDELAAALLGWGLGPGDRVGIWAPNCAEWVLAQFATARAGLVLVNINPAYRTHELEHALRIAGCRALLLARAHKSSDYVAMIHELVPELELCEPGQADSATVPELRLVATLDDDGLDGGVGWARLRQAATPALRQRVLDLQAQLDFDEPVNIQFTSGTTGSPKGATLTHHNILNNGFFVGEAMHLTEADRLCIPVPFYHCFGMVLGNLACVTHGACMVIPGAGFDPLQTLETVQAERCTGLHGVPTMFIAELDHPRFAEFDLSSLRTGIMAGSPCPIEVMRRVVSDMHMEDVTIAYGMTETSPVSFQTVPGDSLEHRVSTVGRVHPHVEVKVVDLDGRVVPRGEPGELLTRGYSVMLGYWNEPEKTREVLDAAGWMHTGDLAVIDEAGYARIVGRIKDMVIRGGENIYPREIEEFLYTHPAVADVQVFGVPDERFGEEVCAWVRLREGQTLEAEALRAFCQGRIAHFKIPRHVHFVDAYPMTVTGKIQKYLMRQRMVELLAEADSTKV